MERNPEQALAWAILTSGKRLSPKEGGFLGQVSFDANPLTERQEKWLRTLAQRHGIEEARHDLLAIWRRAPRRDHLRRSS